MKKLLLILFACTALSSVEINYPIGVESHHTLQVDMKDDKGKRHIDIEFVMTLVDPTQVELTTLRSTDFKERHIELLGKPLLYTYDNFGDWECKDSLVSELDNDDAPLVIEQANYLLGLIFMGKNHDFNEGGVYTDHEDRKIETLGVTEDEIHYSYSASGTFLCISESYSGEAFVNPQNGFQFTRKDEFSSGLSLPDKVKLEEFKINWESK